MLFCILNVVLVIGVFPTSFLHTGEAPFASDHLSSSLATQSGTIIGLKPHVCMPNPPVQLPHWLTWMWLHIIGCFWLLWLFSVVNSASWNAVCSIFFFTVILKKAVSWNVLVYDKVALLTLGIARDLTILFPLHSPWKEMKLCHIPLLSCLCVCKACFPLLWCFASRCVITQDRHWLVNATSLN